MQTRVRACLDTKRLVPLYAVQVYLRGKWCWVTNAGKLQTFKDERSAEKLRAEMRAKKSKYDDAGTA